MAVSYFPFSTRERPPSFSDRPRSMRITSTDSFMSDTSFDENDNAEGSAVDYGNVNKDNEPDEFNDGPVYSAITETVPAKKEESTAAEPPATEQTPVNGAEDTSKNEILVHHNIKQIIRLVTFAISK